MKVEIVDIENIKHIHGVPDNEKETHINFIESDINCILYTRDNKMVTKMKRLVKTNPENYKCYAQVESDGTVVSYEFEFPKKYLRFSTKTRSGRQFTDEERKEIGLRFKKSK